MSDSKMRYNRVAISLQFGLIFGLCLIGSMLNAQNFFDKPNSLNRSRLAGVIITEGVGTIGSLVALNQVWYSQYPRSSFHLFDDNAEWLQVDKVGHSLTAYYIGYAGIEVLKWSGVERKRAIWYGGTLGLIYQTGLETLDGFSEQWGFSIGDMAANVAGSAILIGQELAWDEQRIRLKFSSHLTRFADFRPNILGSGTAERLLKDYNGQTYWLSVNPSSFMAADSKFPRWLNIAVGYGGEEMISGRPNPELYCDNDVGCLQLERYRQWYLSLDVDLTRIPVKSGFLKTVFGTFGFLKIPCPTLEVSNRGVRFHPFYF